MSSFNTFLIFLIFALVVAGQFVPAEVRSNEQSQLRVLQRVPTPTVTAIPSPTSIPIAPPQNLIIDKIRINAPIEPVSVDFDGKMSMPEDYAKVAWYSPGYKPGENGNAVIAGHLDTTTGAPALFYHLDDLVQGDEVKVVAADGKQYRFVVVGKQTYEYDKAPVVDIFGQSDSSNLNLMTCTGWFNRATHNYSHRLVVYTKLQ